MNGTSVLRSHRTFDGINPIRVDATSHAVASNGVVANNGPDRPGAIYQTQDPFSATHTFFGFNVILDNNSNIINGFGSSPIAASGAYTDASGNIIDGGDPMLGEALDNGGGILTLSPLDGSPLIDAGSNANIPPDTRDVDSDGNTTEPLPLDARGALRIINGTVDIGAVEYMRNEKIGGTDAANHIVGGLGKDTMSGLGGADTIDGGVGNDKAHGGTGGDLILGRGGYDVLNGDGGADTVKGGAGNDHANGGAGADTVTGNGGKDHINGGAGADHVAGGGNDDTVNGNAGNDVANDGAGADLLNGGSGNDALYGGNGDDVLNGGAGEDDLKGGGGHDTINGGKGDDKLAGGTKTDTFVFAGAFGHDTLSGFAANDHEVIDLSGVSAITGFHNLVNHHLTSDIDTHHLTSDIDTGFAMITDGTSNTILIGGFTTDDFGAGKAISGADFIFA